jgi:HEAT repeat protein
MVDKAKKLFFDYLGSKFGMVHDGILAEYEQYGVSPVQEDAWRGELIAHWISRLSPHDVTATVKLKIMKAQEALPDMLELADKGDSYAKLIYANALWDVSHSGTPPAALRDVAKQAREMAVRLWREIVRGPIVLTENRDFQPPDGSEVTPYLRSWAADRWKQAVGGGRLPELEGLRSEEPRARRWALERLAAQHDEGDVELVISFLKDPNPKVCSAAIKALEHIGGEVAIHALVRALVEEDRFFYDDFEPGIHSSEYPQRALQRMGRPAIPVLLKALYNDAWIGTGRSGRWRAAWTLGQMKDTAAVTGLAKALSEVGADVRPSVALALGYIGDPAAVPALVKTLREDPIEKVREWAARALKDIASPTALPALMEGGLSDPSSRVRGHSANALGSIGAASAIPTLEEMLHDSDAWVRSRAAAAIERIKSTQ